MTSYDSHDPYLFRKSEKDSMPQSKREDHFKSQKAFSFVPSYEQPCQEALNSLSHNRKRDFPSKVSYYKKLKKEANKKEPKLQASTSSSSQA